MEAGKIIPIGKITVLAIVLSISDRSVLLGQDSVERPNIILILTDDQGYGDLSRHGHPLLKTPHLDQLAEESVRLDNFYVSPSCSPTRAALLTGMHEFRNGVTNTTRPRQRLNSQATILPQLLKSAGYRTGHVGKWHLGGGRGYFPQHRGFDWTSTNRGGPRSHFDPVIIRSFDPALKQSRNVKKVRGYREDIYFDEAMAFIDSCHDQPFFCFIATYSPHTPLAAPKKFTRPFHDKVNEKHAKYLGMVANIDFNVGRLTKYLRERDLEKNTIVIFMNDNGQTEGLDVYNAGMRGCKCTIWEGGSRAISFWRFPDRWKPKTIDNLTAHLDVLPTLCDFANVDVPSELQGKLEGFSLRPLLESDEPIDWHAKRMLFHHVGRWPSGLARSHKHAMCAVRQGNYLLLRSRPCNHPKCQKYVGQCASLRIVQDGGKAMTYTEENAQFHWGVSPEKRWVLFDTKKDPACQVDLAAGNPELVKELSARYDRWWDEIYPEMIDAGGDSGKPIEASYAYGLPTPHKNREMTKQNFVNFCLSSFGQNSESNQSDPPSGTQEKVSKLFDDLDKDQSGTLSIEEFVEQKRDEIPAEPNPSMVWKLLVFALSITLAISVWFHFKSRK